MRLIRLGLLSLLGRVYIYIYYTEVFLQPLTGVGVPRFLSHAGPMRSSLLSPMDRRRSKRATWSSDWAHLDVGGQPLGGLVDSWWIYE